MTKYERWILLLTALSVSVVHVESLRATSLIHAGKFTKLLNLTTTTGSSATDETTSKIPKEKEVPEEQYVEVNGTKIALTGIPQIDYVWDPNLPRELNGFNLSSYPFLDSMPADEDIGFDCEEKINGYYASIKFGCQLYHHCLYGVLNSFICANFTAFDQKTFICHFASEVDCKNSYKYWNRNEDLYKATTERSTTSLSGLVPLIDRNLYKRPLPGLTAGGTRNSSPPQRSRVPQKINPANIDPLPPAQAASIDLLVPARNADDFSIPAVPRRPNRTRRPYRTRRPQVDYYYYDDEYEEDLYDERGRRRQQRPRNRRPVYDDYDSRRPESRRPYNDDFDDYEYERRPLRNRNRSESRKNGDDRRNDDRRFNDRRRPYNDDRRAGDDRRVSDERRRPAEDERRSYDDRKYSDDRKNSDDRRSDDRKKPDEDRQKDDEDRTPNEERIRRKNADEPVSDRGKGRFETKQAAEESSNDDKLVKPAGSLFDRPRAAPKIARPVPMREKNKFSYKTDDETKKKEEYDDEYDDASAEQISSSTASTTTTTTTTTQKPSRTTTLYSPRRQTSTTTKKLTTTEAPEVEYYDDEYEDSVSTSSTTTPKASIDRSVFFNRNANKVEKSADIKPQPTVKTQPAVAKTQPAPAVIKPSFGETFKFNRIKSQNIDPVVNVVTERVFEETTVAQTTSRKPSPTYGGKKFANQQTLFELTTTETTVPVPDPTPEEFSIDTRFNSETDFVDDPRMVVRVIKRPFLPSRGGSPYKARGLQPVGPASLFEADDSVLEAAPSAPETAPPSNFEKTSAAPPNIHKTTLDDIYNEEYDVELNDALNPNLKPLTSSRGISGFSFSSLPIDSRDGYRSQSVKNIQRAEAPKLSIATTEAPVYEYYDDDYDTQ